jgi:hypothetical protein
MQLIKINTTKIKAAGSNFLNLGYCIIVLVSLLAINLTLSVMGLLKDHILIFIYIYIVLIYLIIKNLISAGRNLKFSTQKDYQRVKNIIGESVLIGDLEVAQHDFHLEYSSVEVDLETAMELCSELNFYDKKSLDGALQEHLGHRWRLPTLEELNILYRNKEKLGGFTNGFYWTSNAYEKKRDYIISSWSKNFLHGSELERDKYSRCFARAVRRGSRD